MPFRKMKNGKYRSPSGRVMTKKQVQAYYAKQHGKRKR
jgi:hypothetical protein